MPTVLADSTSPHTVGDGVGRGGSGSDPPSTLPTASGSGGSVAGAAAATLPPIAPLSFQVGPADCAAERINGMLGSMQELLSAMQSTRGLG